MNIKINELWLAGICLLVVIMISVGGVTRLTRSGLSIVEWKPISGIIPPITDRDWEVQFDLYKLSPEFNQVNSHFSIDDYKNIFLWEYAHRLLGRLIFLFVVLPGFLLWRKKWISGRLVISLAGLVALQGLIGWLMVKSGLNIKPHVSPYMLALHFFSALVVLLVPFYQLCKLQPAIIVSAEARPKKIFSLFSFLLALQLFYGCLVSGLKAGIGYNTYPMMNGNFIPTDFFALEPIWINFFENPGAVQWLHRWLGVLVFICAGCLTLWLSQTSAWKEIKNSLIFLLGFISIQIFLGILNIIYVVPISLASTHQLCACAVILAYFNLIFRIENIKPQA